MTPSEPAQVIMPTAPAPPPVFASSPTGKKPGTKSTTPTFLGSGAVPGAPAQTAATKTLLGA